MDKLKISVLFDEDRSNHESTHDEVVDEVVNALTESGHKTSLLGIHNNLHELIDNLEDQKPDLVFNLCETFDDDYYGEMYVAAVLSMMKIRFTGTGPAGMAFRQDKAVTKKLMAFYDVPCPNYATFAKGKLEFAGKMRFPLFVKPLRGDASTGVSGNSLVNDYDSMVKRIDFIHKELNEVALVEEYIDGREFFVSVLGNDPPEVLPLLELDYSKLPSHLPKIYSEKAKFDEESEEYNAINFGVATDLTPELRNSISMVGAKAAHALQVMDYARVDIRLAQDGVPYVVEVNANPYLERTAEFAVAALQAGMGYNTLVNKIAEISWNRWEQISARPKPKKVHHKKKHLVAKKEETKKEEKKEEVVKKEEEKK
ncbi:MAG: ATP-grasp domain-containing protein [Patescibacteria group bacterium]|nr:ATP-grasp domain-containing protein [Patescibacteria group bacterium]